MLWAHKHTTFYKKKFFITHWNLLFALHVTRGSCMLCISTAFWCCTFKCLATFLINYNKQQLVPYLKSHVVWVGRFCLRCDRLAGLCMLLCMVIFELCVFTTLYLSQTLLATSHSAPLWQLKIRDILSVVSTLCYQDRSCCACFWVLNMI